MKKRNIFLSFWAFVIYALIIFAALTYALMGKLTAYLEEYERYQPTTITDTVLEYFESRDTESLKSLPNPGDSLESEAFAAYLERFVDTETLFCYKSSSTDDKLVYDYISDNKKLASLTLSLTDEKSPRGFDVYEIESLVWYPLMKYTVSAPEDCTVYINGKDISQSKAVAEPVYTEKAYEDFDGYKTSTVRYTIEYLEYITEVTAEHDGSAELTISNDGTNNDSLDLNYTISYEMDEAMESELDLRTRDAVKAYINFTTFHSVPVSTVLPYIHTDAALYKNIQRFDNTWNNSRSKEEYTKFDVSDFVYYSDDRASCRVSAVLRLYKYSGTRDYDFDFTLYYIKENGTWYLTSMERVAESQ